MPDLVLPLEAVYTHLNQNWCMPTNPPLAPPRRGIEGSPSWELTRVGFLLSGWARQN